MLWVWLFRVWIGYYMKMTKFVTPIENWPKLYHDILKVKDPTNHVGICTLWTERGIVEKIVEKLPYNVIGNLYSAQGINAMIRNVMMNPNIRTIVIWGSRPFGSTRATVSRRPVSSSGGNGWPA